MSGYIEQATELFKGAWERADRQGREGSRTQRALELLERAGYLRDPRANHLTPPESSAAFLTLDERAELEARRTHHPCVATIGDGVVGWVCSENDWQVDQQYGDGSQWEAHIQSLVEGQR